MAFLLFALLLCATSTLISSLSAYTLISCLFLMYLKYAEAGKDVAFGMVFDLFCFIIMYPLGKGLNFSESIFFLHNEYSILHAKCQPFCACFATIKI